MPSKKPEVWSLLLRPDEILVRRTAVQAACPAMSLKRKTQATTGFPGKGGVRELGVALQPCEGKGGAHRMDRVRAQLFHVLSTCWFQLCHFASGNATNAGRAAEPWLSTSYTRLMAHGLAICIM